MTDTQTLPASDALARILALMVAANGHVDSRELDVLEEMDAFECIGVSRERFAALAHEGVQQIGAGLGECSWLRERDQAYIDGLLDAVTDPDQRLMLCRLAAAVLSADGSISGDERLVYDHVLARWCINRTRVNEVAVLRPRMRR